MEERLNDYLEAGFELLSPFEADEAVEKGFHVVGRQKCVYDESYSAA
jgi:hypothetical protein